MHNQHNNIVTVVGSVIIIMQDTWEKRLAYLQVTVELIAMSSEKQSTHNKSYAQPVSHLFETAVDIAVHGMHFRERDREREREIAVGMAIWVEIQILLGGVLQYSTDKFYEHVYPW
jgi:hemolysin-activating ACP:hemolysin acyltransferase